jgi:hypothetical protein
MTALLPDDAVIDYPPCFQKLVGKTLFEAVRNKTNNYENAQTGNCKCNQEIGQDDLQSNRAEASLPHLRAFGAALLFSIRTADWGLATHQRSDPLQDDFLKTGEGFSLHVGFFDSGIGFSVS